MSNCPECGMALKQNARFCTACGHRIQQVSIVQKAESSVNLCPDCGWSQPEGSRFCNQCGSTVGGGIQTGSQIIPAQSKPDTLVEPVKPKRWLRYIVVTLLALLLLVAHVSYFDFFREPEIKRTLIASYLLQPNDSTPLIIEYGSEVRINIPVGQINQSDSLKLYSLENLRPPEAGLQFVRAYDFEFQKTKDFKEDVEVNVSLPAETKTEGMDFFALHFNEKNGNWEELLTFWDENEPQVSFFTRSFSPVGVSSEERFKGGLNMRIRSMKRPSTLKKIPDIAQSEKILEQYSNFQAPGSNAFRQGMDAVSEAFGLTSAFTGFTEEVARLPIFSKFNSNAGELGVLFSLYQFSVEIYDGKDQQAKLNLSKNLLSYSLGKWGWQGLRIANIGIFIFDYTLTKFGTAMHQMAEEKWEKQYNEFNKTRNRYRKDAAGWKKFMLDNIDNRESFKEVIDAEVHQYLRDFTNDEVVGNMPVMYEETLMAQERIRVYELLNMVVKVVNEEIEKKRQDEIIEKFIALKDLLNSKGQVRVSVFGELAESKEVAGLPVRIKSKKHPEVWKGVTNGAGQFTFDFTWLSYLWHGRPTVVEVIYKNKPLTQEFDMGNQSTDVRFYIDKDSDENEKEENKDLSFSQILSQIGGSYSGICTKTETIDAAGNKLVEEQTQVDAGPNASEQAVKIQVDRSGNANVTIRLSPNDTTIYFAFKGKGKFEAGPDGSPVATFPMNYESRINAQDKVKEVVEPLKKLMDFLVNLYKYSMQMEYRDGVLFARLKGTMVYEGQEAYIVYYLEIKKQ